MSKQYLGFLSVVAVICAAVSASVANAQFVLTPSSASTTLSTEVGSDPLHTIDQSGLNSNYTSGVTDFSTYIASNPLHNSGTSTNRWESMNGSTTGNFVFDLGGSFTIDAFALWNMGGNLSSNIIDFTLEAADNVGFVGATSLGSFSADPNTGSPIAVEAEVFNFTATDASFVRMQITSVNGGGFAGFGEVAFSAVPEPSSIALICCGAVGVFMHRRRKRCNCQASSSAA